MAAVENKTAEPFIVVCHGIDDTVHVVEIMPGQVLDSGQPNIVEFRNDADDTLLKDAVSKLTVAEGVKTKSLERLDDFRTEPKTRAKVQAVEAVK